MTKAELLHLCDHTLLKREMSTDDMRRTVAQALKYETASVCLPPYFVPDARKYGGEKLNICTVIAFPNGYAATEAKLEEAKTALGGGANELDMVINLSMVRDRALDAITGEINALKDVCGERILKVIIETCLLAEEEKLLLCRLVSDSRADFIKTSTGFSTGGATFADVELMRKYCAPRLRIKAAGGISSFEDAEKFVALGASRLGTSRLVSIAEKEGL